MTIAFVISNDEEEIVNHLAAGSDEPYPSMDGSLFKFRRRDVKPFIARVLLYANALEPGDAMAQPAQRLLDRMGSWIGKNLAEAPDEQIDLFPTKAPAPLKPMPRLGSVVRSAKPVVVKDE